MAVITNAALSLLTFGVFCCTSTFQTSSLKFRPRSFSIDYESDTFMKDGEPFRYISGSIHYSRVHHFYWKDRLLKMFTAGLDAVQVYVPWNVHEPSPGVYDFAGQQDLVRFISLAHSVGLLVILRAGPYICGEWEFGGFPSWILKNQHNITLRSMDPAYIGPVERWLSVLLPKMQPLLYNNGGPIITVQVENEYGSYSACDHEYLAFLRDTFIKHLGKDTVLFTTDGAGVGYLKCGKIPNVYATVDFGPGNASAAFISQRTFEKRGPLVNSEYYTGWLDYWGEPHSRTATVAVIKTLDQMLSLGANVNMYMFEGGTNFGYMNGADPLYKPVPTSYDYDAPLSEAGDITEKYKAIRSLISKYKNLPQVPVPPSTKKYAYGKVYLDYAGSLMSDRILSDHSALTSTLHSRYPVSMEDIGQSYGFIMYRTDVTVDVAGESLSVPGLRDRAYISVNEKPVAMLDRNEVTKVMLDLHKGDHLSILVENMGRINYGTQINDNRKGIISNVTLAGRLVENWTIFPVHLENIIRKIRSSGVSPRPGRRWNLSQHSPTLFTGSFVLPTSHDQPCDSFMKLSDWFKGQVFINDFNVGRYWPVRGPQITLYVPAPILKPYPQVNYVTIAELEFSRCSVEKIDNCYVEFVSDPILNGTTTFSNERWKEQFISRANL